MLDCVIDALVSALTAKGINAVASYPSRSAEHTDTVCISLKSAELGPHGYVGLAWENGAFSEMYGSTARLRLGVKLYCTDSDCDLLAESVLSAVSQLGGISVTGFELGELRFDAESEMFVCECLISGIASLIRKLDASGDGGFELGEDEI